MSDPEGNPKPLESYPKYNPDAFCTPKWLADALGYFDCDPCSNPRSHIRSGRALSLENGDDGLAAVWMFEGERGSIFCNGPYSDPLPWCLKLAAHPGPWCALWKLDTTTRWWAELMASGAQWAGFRKRLKFEQPGKAMTANFASALCWNNGWAPGRELRSHLWIASYDTRSAA